MDERNRFRADDVWRGRKGVWLAAAVVAGAALAAYWNTLSNPFVFDDVVALSQNPSIRKLWPLTGVLQPPETTTLGGRPLANLTFALNYAVSGNSPRGYHAANLALHALAALVLLAAIRRTLERIAVVAPRTAVPLAAAIALLWAVHPLATGTVGYISQRTELLMAVCYLLTLYGFVRSLDGSGRAWLALSVATCACGMASKESMVTAPVAVVLYDVAFISGGLRAALRSRRGYYAALAATWLLLAWLMSSHLAQRSVGFGLGVTWRDYVLTECAAVALYAKLALWPHPLVFDYGPVFVRHALAVAPHALLLTGALAAVAFAWKRRPAAGFAALWFFLVLAPTSSVVPIALQPIAENRVYLPAAGLVALALAGATAALGRRVFLPALALAAAFGVLVFQRNLAYRTEARLWADTIAKRPQNPRAHTNLGEVLVRQGRLDRAVECFTQAVVVDPRHPEAHNDLGYAQLLRGRVEPAIAHLEDAVRLKPEFAMAHSNLAAAYNAANRFAEALAQADTALRLAPLLPETHYHAGNALLGLGRASEAIAHLEAQLRAQPDHVNSHYLLAHAFLALGRPADAARSLEQVIRLTPAFAEAYNDLGQVLLRLGRTEDAMARFTECLRLSPQHEAARKNLAALRESRPPPQPSNAKP